MKNKNIWKNSTGVVVLIVLILLTIFGFMNANAGIITESTKTFENATSTLNGTGNIFCLEQGVAFSGKRTYNVSEAYNVTDPHLTYILNLTNGNRTNFGLGDIKQNLIWWYLNTRTSTWETQTIKTIAGYDGTPYSNSWPVAGKTLELSDVQGYIDEVVNYATKINNPGISITSARISGENLVVNVTSQCIDGYDLYINDVHYANYSSEVTTIDIPLSKFSTETVKIVVKGYINEKTAQFQVLYTADKQQALINVIPGDDIKTVRAESSIEPTLDTNVSLQKYITKVNDASLTGANTTLTDRKNAVSSVASGNISKNNSVIAGNKKQDTIVNIEAGDTVTYRIYVYNNSSVPATTIRITDTLPTTKLEYTISNGLSGSFENGGSINIDTSLAANESKYFDVTIKFQKETTGKLTNKAEITATTPNNNKTYRTVDEDYVQMDSFVYSVGLEKYVTKVETTEIKDSEIDVRAYTNMIQHIIKTRKEQNITSEEALNRFVEKANNAGSEYISKYDINKDGKINSKDSELFKRKIEENIKDDFELLESYIKADLNSDSKVDGVDVELYEAYSQYVNADINKDSKIDKLDKYAYILKYLQDNGHINADTLINFYIANVNEDINTIRTNIEEYIKADVNDDGLIDIQDKYILDENTIKVFYNKLVESEDENGNKVYEINEDFNEYSIYDSFQGDFDPEGVKEIINLGDINEDGEFDSKDVEIVNSYIDFRREVNNEDSDKFWLTIDYINYEFWSIEKFEGLIEDLEGLTINVTEGMRNLFGIDSTKTKITFKEYVDYYNSHINYIDTDENGKNSIIESDIVTEISTSENIINYNINNDSCVDVNDYELLKYYLKIRNIEVNIEELPIEMVFEGYGLCEIGSTKLEFYGFHNAFDKDENDKKLNQEDIIAIELYRGLKEYDDQKSYAAYKKYDLNKDGKINIIDKELIDNYSPINIENDDIYNDLYGDILITEKYEEFIHELELWLNGKTNNININSISYKNLSNLIGNGNLEINQQISNKISNTSDEEIKYIWSLCGANGITQLDVNDDKSITEEDLNYAKSIFESVDYYNKDKTKKISKEIENYINRDDIDGDSDVDSNDYILIEEGKAYININNEQIENAVKRAIGLDTYTGTPSNTENVENREGHPIYNQGGCSKENNPVVLEVGDTVTYTIKLTNTGERNIKVTNITDTFDNGLTYITGSATGYGTITETISGNTLTLNITNSPTLTPGLSKYITLKFLVGTNTNKETIIDTSKQQTLKNTATVNTITNKNDAEVTDRNESDPVNGLGTWNNTDSDWVKTKIYSVSLEKYVSQVTDANGGNIISSYGDSSHNNYRGGKRYSDNNKWKENNQVQLEPGDIVTYTIKLKNTAKDNINYGKIYVTQISDSFRYGETGGNYEGIKLVYDTEYGIQGNNGGRIINTHYSSDANNSNKDNDVYLIQFDAPIILGVGQEIQLNLRFKVDIAEANTNSVQTNISNKACIQQLQNSNKAIVKDSDGSGNNCDIDFVKTKIYRVSLQKIVYSVNDNIIVTTTDGTTFDRWASWESNAKQDKKKYNNPVIVQKGDKIVYAIKVTNNHDTLVHNIKVNDILPTEGLNLSNIKIEKIKNASGQEYTVGTDIKNYIKDFNKGDANNQITFTLKETLSENQNNIVYVSAEVTESNMSIAIRRNYAEIVDPMKNRNAVSIKDNTGNDNQDADYFQTRDIILGGNVWNDIATNKTSDYYNGMYDSDERPIKDVKVMLYRVNTNNLVATTWTDENGSYIFSNTDLSKQDRVSNGIKASKENGNNRWKTYNSYYIVFEYDGVTYTSTPDGTTIKDITNNTSANLYKKDSNAKEDNTNGKTGLTTRSDFNNRFATINNNSDISYTTRNESGYIPQSILNSKVGKEIVDKYKMQSSTNIISIETIAKLSSIENIGKVDIEAIKEDMLNNIGLGLRGRDVFDLELTSSVDNVKVTVNGNKQGVYDYSNSNKVTIRRTDLYKEENNKYYFNNDEVQREDMANRYSQESFYNNEDNEFGKQEQPIRISDLNKEKAKNSDTFKEYSDTQELKDIKVTYKITVKNASQTDGIATKITSYYDKCYSNPEEFKLEMIINNETKTSDKVTKADEAFNDTYNKIDLDLTEAINEILGNNGMLEQSQSCYVYITYTMDVGILKEVFKNTDTLNFPTYNMVEITEYKTKCGNGQTEYTRGLIDKDSAPGSVEEEEVRTKDTEGQATPTIGGNPTTVQYYFSKTVDDSVDLSKLKYEDDTYATPTLYFVSNDATRKITGTVFEDYTMLINNDDDDNLIRVKTGDGKQLGDEPGIKGVEVRLIENTDDGSKIRYITTTDENGSYTFESFLPGDYYIEYHYGNTGDTFVFDNNPNTKSYNGEDFQSTNNTGLIAGNPVDNITLYPLNNTENFWYAYNKNEGISTAIDNQGRREEVSTDVISFSDDQMTGLNNARDGLTLEESNVEFIKEELDIGIMGATQMFASTNPMTLTVEETIINDNDRIQKDNFSEYEVSNMNFGIAEVPVTTIDFQKHVYSFKITDSTGKNTLAAMKKDLSNTAVTVNPSKIAKNRIDTVIDILSENLGLNREDVDSMIAYNREDRSKNENSNKIIKTGLTIDEINKLENAIAMKSLGREIKIVQAWETTAGNVIAPPGTGVIDVSIEDDKLQGAKLEITYEISANISAEKNFNNDAVTIPSIKGIVDYIDNNLAYAEETETIKNVEYDKSTGVRTETNKPNKENWTITNQDNIKFGERGTIYESRFGTLDPDGTKFTTALLVNEGNSLLREECGKGTTYITLEKVLTSTDSILDKLIGDADIYVYENGVEITQLDYTNQTSSESDFIYRDRVRTTDRYIILAGRQHDSAISETITIHPPTGDMSVHIVYYMIALISLAVLASGVFAIKKFVVKK